MMHIDNILNTKKLKLKRKEDSVNKVWYAIMTMDIIELYLQLDESINYYDLDKLSFLKKLHNRFDNHRTIKDEEFYLHLRGCSKLHEGEPVCEFVGMASGINLGMIFDFKNKEIVGIKFCDCLGSVQDVMDYDASFNS
jgi:hypothetical protein